MADDVPQIPEKRPSETGAAAFPPLMEAKLAVPSARRGTIDRPRIRGLLSRGEDAAMTLVVAPAGYGKTTAVRAWCTARDAALAWVSLDAGDNDPSRLWRYVATAVDRVRPGLGRTSLQRLSFPGASVIDAVDELMNGVASFGRPLVIVLDDLHVVSDELCLASLDHALAYLPANGHIVVIARQDPVLDVARKRANRLLTELRARELSFDQAEAHELLVTRGGLSLGSQEVHLLVERTEGWPAALILAGIWLRTLEDQASAVREFGGEHRFVADYLSEEVLASLGEDLRDFVHGIAVLGEFTVDLCDDVLDRSDSRARLAEVERANLFVSRLGRSGWFRLHPLFAEYVRAQYGSLDSVEANGIHRRAADWLRAHGMPVEAAQHATAAGDHEMVASLLLEYYEALIRSGASATLLRWLRTLPDECVVAHPELTVAGAVAALLSGESVAEQRGYLRLADQTRAGDGPNFYVETWAAIVRALALHGGPANAVANSRRALALATDPTDTAHTAALVAHSRALFFAGDLDESSRIGLQALDQPGVEARPPTLALARSTLALVAVEQGRLSAARKHAEKAKAALAPIGADRTWLSANVTAAVGAVLAAEEKFAEAEHELAAAAKLFADEGSTLYEAWLLVLLARVRTRRGRLDEAAAALGAAREMIDEFGDSGRVPAIADDVSRELESARQRAGGGEVLEAPSDAELVVLRLLATGLSIGQVAQRLFLSPNTVRSHTRVVYRKLGVHSRADLVARATELGLLDHPTALATDHARTEAPARVERSRLDGR